ncbi:hypothetical protein MPC1_2980002 [Methylocella tundrae]|nr:hypothetical protein MPC1_2980002 [Methylocella tundrae]
MTRRAICGCAAYNHSARKYAYRDCDWSGAKGNGLSFAAVAGGTKRASRREAPRRISPRGGKVKSFSRHETIWRRNCFNLLVSMAGPQLKRRRFILWPLAGR